MRKHLLLFTFLFFLSGLTMAQDVSAFFANGDAVVENHDAETWSSFELQATAEQMENMKTELAKYEREFTFKAEATEVENRYQCQLVYSHHIDQRYLHKTFLVMQVTQFKVGTAEHPLNDLLTTTF